MNTPDHTYTKWKETAARAGHVAKGAVYGIAGVLTLLAAFNLGGKTAGKMQVIEFLTNQPFGQILLVIMALGLACYSFFRFMQVTGRSESLENDSEKKRMVKKIAFAISGIIYLALAIYALSFLWKSSSGQSGFLRTLMSHDLGIAAVYLAALLMLIKAIYQVIKVINKKYYKHVRGMDLGVVKARNLVRKAGAWGILSRSILIAITAYLFFQAANHHDPSKLQGSSGAFSFLSEMSSGPWLVGIVAFGLICYAVYMFIVAWFKEFHIK